MGEEEDVATPDAAVSSASGSGAVASGIADSGAAAMDGSDAGAPASDGATALDASASKGAAAQDASASGATAEDLLYAWLRFTTSVKTERVLQGFPFREVMVYGCLHRIEQEEPDACVSATRLCEELRIQKPQMAILLSRMEEKGLIKRERSQTDRRVVRVSLTGASLPLYEEEHRRVMQVVTDVAERYGMDRLEDLVKTFDELSEIAGEVIW